MASQTANGQFSYDAEYHGKTLDNWVQSLHQHNSVSNGWKYYPLKRGAFGYDNLAVSVGHVFNTINADPSILKDKIVVERIAALIHDGWSINYVYWRENKPYLKFKDMYFRPVNPINDERRNMCADKNFCDLPEDEMEKDRLLAKYLYEKLME